MRILYVEDNEVNQALVERVARIKQYVVTFVEEGEEALDALANNPDIDLVLLDIELAGSMDGLDVVKTLRARNDPRPVVAITAYAMMGDRERILNAGCDQYLPKPLVITDLLALFEHYETRVAPAPSVPAAVPATAGKSGNGTGESAKAAPTEAAKAAEAHAPTETAKAAAPAEATPTAPAPAQPADQPAPEKTETSEAVSPAAAVSPATPAAAPEVKAAADAAPAKPGEDSPAGTTETTAQTVGTPTEGSTPQTPQRE